MLMQPIAYLESDQAQAFFVHAMFFITGLAYHMI